MALIQLFSGSGSASEGLQNLLMILMTVRSLTIINIQYLIYSMNPSARMANTYGMVTGIFI